MKIAQVVANKYKKLDVNAVSALEIVLNENIHAVAKVSIYHREITFKDGSLVMIRDTSHARAVGLTDSDYAIAYQDAAY